MAENLSDRVVNLVVGFAVLGLFVVAAMGISARSDVGVGPGVCLIAAALALGTILFGVLRETNR